MSNPEMYGGKMVFTQDADSCNSGTQEIEIEVLDAGAGKYMILKTEAWSIDNLEDIKGIIEQVRAAFF